MDNFIVSARKYRPTSFDSVVGQQHITNTLKNAIKNNQLAQAFLFCGPRGVGKTTCARILAKTINCENIQPNHEACDECSNCQSFAQGTSFSVHELDAASNNSVDDIRTLIEQVRIPPQAGKYKIYIIDEVHMLSQSAFNAFLKTLEEPPSYAIFILATTEKHKILPTILSRCQIFDFNRIKVEDMTLHLKSIAEKEAVKYESDGLHVIAQKADGGLRDALSMFDQIVSFTEKNITYNSVIENLSILDYDYYFKVSHALYAEFAADALLIFNEVLSKGFEGSQFMVGLNAHFRNLLMAKEPATVTLLELSDGVRQRYLDQSVAISSGWLLSVLNVGNQCEINYKSSKNQRLQIELALLKMSHVRAALQMDQRMSLDESRPSIEKKKSPESEVVTPEEHQAPAKRAEPEPAIPTETPAKDPTPPAKKETPAANWGNARLGGGIMDMAADTISDQDEDEPTLVTGTEIQPFSEETFLNLWHELASDFKKENKINLFTLLTANAPRILPDHLIEVVIENKIQEDLLQISKFDIVNTLRVKLKNYKIDLMPLFVEHSVERKPYTSMEKFQVMLRKNPLLERFQQEFNLGLD